MGRITIITPVGPAHAHLVERVRASVAAQTTACAHLVIHDSERRGPGWARNTALAQVTTPLVTFLDTDDLIDPAFAETMLAGFDALGGKFYLYPDIRHETGEVEAAPQCPWVNGAWHVVTALVPTAWARAVGGFDETMTGGEDADFYMKLAAAGYCGRRLPAPLFVYGRSGLRSMAWRASGAELDTMLRWSRQYGGEIVGCCGDESAPVLRIERLPGDMLARPAWFGRRHVRSSVTGRDYGRIDGHSLIWIDVRDLSRGFVLVDQPAPQPAAPAPEAVVMDDEIARIGLAMGLLPPTARPVSEVAAPPAARSARVAALMRKVDPAPMPVYAAKVNHRTAGATTFFVRAAQGYSSYRDFWRLVTLAGYSIIEAPEVDLTNAADTYIFVTPEPWPDVSGAAARCIAWELEYAGDYTHDTGAWGGELWASDTTWAKEHNARFVLMGSDARLAMDASPQPSDVEMTIGYDVTLLGYMTPRRARIKAELPSLRWTADYPGDQIGRHTILSYTRLMLHVHQHEDARYTAPLRIALAAAYKLPVVSEAVYAPGPYHKRIWYADYGDLAREVKARIANLDGLRRRGDTLHEWLCVKQPFADIVKEALARSDDAAE